LETTSILIADDHAVVLRGLRALLESHAGWNVCEVSDGWQAVESAKKLRPDIVILDISMADLDGLEATARILEDIPNLPVLVLTMQDDKRFVEEALEAGARGYVLKSDAERDLIMAVEALLDGRTFFTSAVSKIVLDSLRHHKTEEKRRSRGRLLGMRDRKIVQLLATGKSNKDVASRLNISVRTAEYHRARIMRMLGQSSLSGVVHYAIRNKIVEA
jgi:DNA-binding NarL/FixJ family response regulator